MKWDKYSFGQDNCNDLLYKLDTLKENFQYEELIPESLWVMHNNNPDKDGYCSLDFAFFDFNSSDGDGSNVELNMIMYGWGPTGTLKECRHTYWGKDGYIFYPNKKKIEIILNWLSVYFDME